MPCLGHTQEHLLCNFCWFVPACCKKLRTLSVVLECSFLCSCIQVEHIHCESYECSFLRMCCKKGGCECWFACVYRENEYGGCYVDVGGCWRRFKGKLGGMSCVLLSVFWLVSLMRVSGYEHNNTEGNKERRYAHEYEEREREENKREEKSSVAPTTFQLKFIK